MNHDPINYESSESTDLLWGFLRRKLGPWYWLNETADCEDIPDSPCSNLTILKKLLICQRKKSHFKQLLRYLVTVRQQCGSLYIFNWPSLITEIITIVKHQCPYERRTGHWNMCYADQISSFNYLVRRIVLFRNQLLGKERMCRATHPH